MHICFDIDGTLAETGADVDFDDGSSILRHTRPAHAALTRLKRLKENGATVSFVTARNKRVTWATYKQLRQWLGDEYVRGTDIFHMEAPYEMMAAICYKFDALRYLKPDLYVGDQPADQTAAAAAGVKFMPAEWFAKGLGLEQHVNADFLPNAVRGRAPFFGYTGLEHDYATGLDVRQSESLLHGAGGQVFAPSGTEVSAAHPEGAQE